MKPPNRIARLVALAGALVFVGACGGSALRALVGVAAHNVNITPGVPQGDTVYFDIANSDFSSAYLQECGDGPALSIQVQQGGNWVAYGPAVTCPAPTVPGPIELKSGAELVVNREFTQAGKYRVGVSVGTSVTMSDAQMAYTVGFTIK